MEIIAGIMKTQHLTSIYKNSHIKMEVVKIIDNKDLAP